MTKNTQKQLGKISLIIFTPVIPLAYFLGYLSKWLVENDSIQELTKSAKTDIIELYKETFK